MKILRLIRALGLMFVISYGALNCKSEEPNSGIMTQLSSTTISGYVDTTASFSNTNASAPGFAGIWIGIIRDRSSTNRIELYFVVDDIGNFAGRGLSFDRTRGSSQFEGTLDRNGTATVGQTKFHFRRHGPATVIRRGGDGRFFSARLLREEIREVR